MKPPALILKKIVCYLASELLQRELDTKRIANVGYRALTYKPGEEQMTARKHGLKEMDVLRSCMKKHKQVYTFQFLGRKHQPSWLRCACDSFWKGIMLMPWPLDVDVFASLKGLFLLPSSLLSGTQNPGILIKWERLPKRRGTSLVGRTLQEL